MAGGRRDAKGAVQTGAAKAKAALQDGDFTLARSAAQSVLDDANASETEKDEAREVLDATRIDRGPIVAGFVILSILIVLFIWVVLHRPAS